MTGMQQLKDPRWARLLVLGMLFLRALIPAGFMLAPLDGGLTMVVCDAAMSAGEHAHHHHPGHDGPAHPEGAHSDPTCPYAQSAGPAPLPTLPTIAGAAASDWHEPPATVAQIFSTCGPVREQTPRGPPVLA
jgi:hypothetical protein